MRKVMTVCEMRDVARRAESAGFSAADLARRAGRALAETRSDWGGTAIFCGPGDKGAIGHALALELKKRGARCALAIVEEGFSPVWRELRDRCADAGIERSLWPTGFDLGGFDSVVDCVCAADSRGAPTGKAKDCVERINASDAFVVSACVNSGLDSVGGLFETAVRSDLTVCFGAYAPGVFLGMAKDCVGSPECVDIGLSFGPCRRFAPEPSDFSEHLARRRNFAHKGAYGTAALFGGSPRYPGALKLCALACAALRSGCGLSRIASCASLSAAIANLALDCTFVPFRERFGDIRFDRSALSLALTGATAVAVGPGWTKSRNRRRILRHILSRSDVPTIVDADGLNLLSDDLGILRDSRAKIVLTPHLGEMSRLTRLPVSALVEDPLRHAEEFCAERGVAVVLKGPTTVVSDGNVSYLVSTGCPGMATAGSGDVLTGILLGVLAQPFDDPLLAAAYAAHLNGVAGELAQAKRTDASMCASDTVSEIGNAVAHLRDVVGI